MLKWFLKKKREFTVYFSYFLSPPLRGIQVPLSQFKVKGWKYEKVELSETQTSISEINFFPYGSGIKMVDNHILYCCTFQCN